MEEHQIWPCPERLSYKKVRNVIVLKMQAQIQGKILIQQFLTQKALQDKLFFNRLQKTGFVILKYGGFIYLRAFLRS